MAYAFAIGSMSLKQGATVVKSITNTIDANINYSIATHKEYGPEGQVTSEEVETEEMTIECSYYEATYDTTISIGQYYDVVLATDAGARSMPLTLANCRITGYTVNLTQDGFTRATLTFSKKGKPTDAPGATVAKQTVQFGSTYLGDSAYIEMSYEGNVISHIIPTALGTIFQSTAQVGGGVQELQVQCYVSKTTRLEAEQYLMNLAAGLSTSAGTLTVTYGGSSYTITNCYFKSLSKSGGSGKYANFTVNFIRNPYGA